MRDAIIEYEEKYGKSMDTVEIEKSGDCFRLLLDTKGRFFLHRIEKTEAEYKLCKVTQVFLGPKGVPQLVTHDGRTIRYPHPAIKVNDTVKVNLATGKITEYVKFETGNLCYTAGNNAGRIGVVTHSEKHDGSFTTVQVTDASGVSFATRMENVFIIGNETKSMASLPKAKGVRCTNIQDRKKRLEKLAA
eukprot:gnl/Ergobibamus_cyprinoides/3243.p2 GENE.gnl/Ergobibamus_cyprinoides/3243~~gnl/Ergobibamus_cyprinoides/3243.p2  ORF type:complete len:209 (+),score=107.89 gnl/Ergobibamus_cyprinoides/3243:58-627(+)